MSYVNGCFDAVPKKASECKGCFANALCGRSRAGEIDEGELES